MAAPKKGALHQLLVVMVDSTDFASIESGITESDFNSGVTKKFYGVNTGASTAVTSGTISKTASLVRSGVFRVTLKTTENNYDQMMVRFNKTGCAEQIYTWSNVDNDDSDIMSAILSVSSIASDAASAAQQANSRVLLNKSTLSDIQSYLLIMSGIQSDILSAVSDLQSDFQSRVPKRVATDSQLSDLHSDLKSYLAVMSGILSDTYSNTILHATTAVLSDFYSDFQSRVPKAVATNSQLSDLHSDLKSYLAVMSGIQSDIYSTVVLGATQASLSDLASDLRSYVAVMSGVQSDIYSTVLLGATAAVLSDFYSDFVSKVPKKVATDSALSDARSDIKSAIAGITVTIGASDVSDIASAVVAGLPLSSDVSNIYALLSSLNSEFLSRVPKRVATDSQLSDVSSDLRSALGTISTNLTASDISDVASAVVDAIKNNITETP